MKKVRVTQLIATAAICWIVLIFLQVSWIKRSRDLVEEQFDQKVTLSLCHAISHLNETGDISCVNKCGSVSNNFIIDGSPGPEVAGGSWAVSCPDTALHSAMAKALHFYDIHMDFEIAMVTRTDAEHDQNSPYLCSLLPSQPNNDQYLSLIFPNKSKYLLGEIWFMLVSAGAILLIILLIFFFTVQALLKHKRFSNFYFDFFNNTAHELRTPLTNVGLAIKRLVSKQPALNDDPYLQIALEEKNKLNDQLERVLNMAKLENGKYSITKEPVSATELIHDILEDIKLLIQEHNARVVIDPSLTDLNIFGDRLHLKHAFRNIIDNSIKYCRQNPLIRIYAETSPDSTAIIFTDNGIGISKYHQELVFKKFYRVYNGNLHDKKGFGLGLAYVKMIMEQHRGSIRIASEKNKGSKFVLSLPN